MKLFVNSSIMQFLGGWGKNVFDEVGGLLYGVGYNFWGYIIWVANNQGGIL